jgi:hypothetical protein
MLFSIELLWCLIFVQKSNFQWKFKKNWQKSYFTRRPTEPEDETEGRHEASTHIGGATQPWPRPPVVRAARPSPRPLLPPTYILGPENIGETVFFLDRLPLCRRHQKPWFGTRNSILAPCRDGDLEEIFITIITDVPPSTIHDSPIHVWVILLL